jgi:hypothetical protein
VRITVFMTCLLSLLYIAFSPVAADTGSASTDVADAAEKIWLATAKEFGLWAALCVTLIGSVLLLTWLREKRMAKRIDDLEAARHAEIMSVSKALSENGASLRQMVSIQTKQLEEMQKLSIELHVRPCLK